ncbi:MAG: DUF393 domain-containing protein [Melioribacteraceae bacterium]|nr:DUF393 domain-containing protein [Melioribacteraceae bacterium]
MILNKKSGNYISDLIIVDGDCILCSRLVQFIIKYDNQKFMFTSLNSEFIKEHNLTVQSDSVILIKGDQFYFKSDAVFEIIKDLKSPIKYLRFFKHFPKSLRDYIYDIIANNRYKIFGKKNECLINKVDISRIFR